MNVLLISTYELGHQPFGLAHPAAVLRELGASVESLDLAVQPFDRNACRAADLIGFYLPMHTATRLAISLIVKVKELNPKAHIAGFGLYAPLNETYLRSLGMETILGGEFEPGLIELFHELLNKSPTNKAVTSNCSVPRQRFVVPYRKGLPKLSRYANLRTKDDRRKTVGYTESSRGCKHLCRHCPVVPVYQGRFRAIPVSVVLADIRQQVEAGAEHITFGDPDFLNGPAHAVRIVKAMHREFPDLTYDVTIKVEHLLAQRQLLPVLKETGCLFITTAVESVDNEILSRLQKGHTRDDFYELMEIIERVGLDLSPTFVPFTPWTTVQGYIDLLSSIAELGLVRCVAPVQLSIRLLIPPGSLLLELEEILSMVGTLDREKLIYPWKNADHRVERLQTAIRQVVENSDNQPREEVFKRIYQLTVDGYGLWQAGLPDKTQRPAPARLSEPWYCCAEPTDSQYKSGL